MSYSEYLKKADRALRCRLIAHRYRMGGRYAEAEFAESSARKIDTQCFAFLEYSDSIEQCKVGKSLTDSVVEELRSGNVSNTVGLSDISWIQRVSFATTAACSRITSWAMSWAYLTRLCVLSKLGRCGNSES